LPAHSFLFYKDSILLVMEDDIKQLGEYTNWPQRKTFKEEKEMVRIAVENHEDNAMRKYLTTLIKYWIEDFKINQPQIKLTEEEFLEASLMYLELGLKQYYKRVKEGNIGFKFSTYFEWFIRQGFLDYFKQKDGNR